MNSFDAHQCASLRLVASAWTFCSKYWIKNNFWIFLIIPLEILLKPAAVCVTERRSRWRWRFFFLVVVLFIYLFFPLSDYRHYSSGKTQIEVHLHELAPGKWLDKKAPEFACEPLAERRWCTAVTLLCKTPGGLPVCSGLFPFKRVDLSPVHEVWAWPLKRVWGRGSVLAERWWSKRLLWVQHHARLAAVVSSLRLKYKQSTGAF